MITVHHLNHSRSHRILWLLEELELPYEIAFYERDATLRAPAELRAVHPLGKSPVITEGARTIAESGAIIDYILRRHGHGRLVPPAGSDAYEEHQEWLHYGEGSGFTPFLLGIFVALTGTDSPALAGIVDAETKLQLDYLDLRLGDKPYLVGDDLTGADIQIGYVVDFADQIGKLGDHPRLVAYAARLRDRPAYARALERGGPYDMTRFKGG